MNYIEELNSHENQLIEKLRNHPILSGLDKLTTQQFEHFLLQRRFFSLNFTPVVEHVLVGLENQEAKKILGWLIREEYPSDEPSHREAIISDLVKIGISKNKILTTKPTNRTQQVIDQILKLVEYQENFDLKGITTTRFIFEVCPGEEYELIVKELERRCGMKRADSVFYWPHFEHDKKAKVIGETAQSHSDKFNIVFSQIIDSKENLYLAKGVLEEACKIKLDFYNQFLPEGGSHV